MKYMVVGVAKDCGQSRGGLKVFEDVSNINEPLHELGFSALAVEDCIRLARKLEKVGDSFVGFDGVDRVLIYRTS